MGLHIGLKEALVGIFGITSVVNASGVFESPTVPENFNNFDYDRPPVSTSTPPPKKEAIPNNLDELFGTFPGDCDCKHAVEWNGGWWSFRPLRDAHGNVLSHTMCQCDSPDQIPPRFLDHY